MVITGFVLGIRYMAKMRYIQTTIETLCFVSHKMAFISGARQCGKTTLSKCLLKERGAGKYFNWDEKGFRLLWTKHPLGAVEAAVEEAKGVPIVVLDEIHKAKLWKRNLKGVFDSLKLPVDIVVTGSAKLNVYRRGSDSLLGRYHHFRLHPFSLAELSANKYTAECQDLLKKLFDFSFTSNASIQKNLELLWQFGPFPEPLFAANKKVLNLWQSERIQRLIREDLRDLSRIQELSQIEMLVALMPERASGVLSITALREEMEVTYSTMKLWINYLKQVYYLFEIKPYSQSMPRSLKKEGKVYLYDWSEVESEGARFENMIASHLLKYTHFLCDSGEAKVKLHYLKNKEKKEIDFLLVKDNKPWLPIEVKLNDESLSKNWSAYLKHLSCKQGVQVIKKPGIRKIVSINDAEVLVISAEYFLPLLV